MLPFGLGYYLSFFFRSMNVERDGGVAKIARVPPTAQLTRAQDVDVAFAAEHVRLFDAATGGAIPVDP